MNAKQYFEEKGMPVGTVLHHVRTDTIVMLYKVEFMKMGALVIDKNHFANTWSSLVKTNKDGMANIGELQVVLGEAYPLVEWKVLPVNMAEVIDSHKYMEE